MGVQQEVKLCKSMLMLNSKIGSQNLIRILSFRCLFQSSMRSIEYDSVTNTLLACQMIHEGQFPQMELCCY